MLLERCAERDEVGGVDVQGRSDDVHHLRVGQPRDEAEAHTEVKPPRTPVRPLHRFDAHQRTRGARDEIAERRPRAPRVVRRRDAPAFDQKSLQTHQKDRDENQASPRSCKPASSGA